MKEIATFRRKMSYLFHLTLWLIERRVVGSVSHRGSGRDDVGNWKKGDPVVNKADFQRKPLLLGVKCGICCIRHRGTLSDGSWGLFHIVALVATMWESGKR